MISRATAYRYFSSDEVLLTEAPLHSRAPTATQLFSGETSLDPEERLLKANAAKYGPLALIQFDAHQDTWPDKLGTISHGTFVKRAVVEGLIDPAHSIQIGIRTEAPETCGIEVVSAGDLDMLGVDGITTKIVERVGDARAYLTFDIDCLDPAFAPGTGTPVAGGLSSREALAVLRRLGGLKLVGGDVVEVAPPYDHADITAIAAATVAMYYIGLLAERRLG